MSLLRRIAEIRRAAPVVMIPYSLSRFARCDFDFVAHLSRNVRCASINAGRVNPCKWSQSTWGRNSGSASTSKVSASDLSLKVTNCQEKTLAVTDDGERFASEAGGTRTRNLRIDSPAGQSSNSQKPQRLAKQCLLRATNDDTNSPENEHGKAGGKVVSSRAESLPIKGDSFSAALAMIASLPLSEAEKADAVRRLMAERRTEGG